MIYTLLLVFGCSPDTALTATDSGPLVDWDDRPIAERCFPGIGDASKGLPDYDQFVRQAAALFEKEGFRDEALRWYERVLVARTTDAGLMVKVGELHAQLGRDEVAGTLYRSGVDLLLSRRPLAHTQALDLPHHIVLQLQLETDLSGALGNFSNLFLT